MALETLYFHLYGGASLRSWNGPRALVPFGMPLGIIWVDFDWSVDVFLALNIFFADFQNGRAPKRTADRNVNGCVIVLGRPFGPMFANVCS